MIKGMRSPYGLDIIETCLGCKAREDYLFCGLEPKSLQALERIRSIATYPAGATLFQEGQAARGIFVLCHGSAKLSTSSSDGKTIILRIAQPGEVLALSSTISGKPHEVTGETLQPTQANFVGRDEFLRFLREHGDVALRVAEELSNNYYAAYAGVRAVLLVPASSWSIART